MAVAREEDLIDDVAVVLVAGGRGTRLGSERPKGFVGLGGKVLLAHSLEAFEAHDAVDSIVLVVPEDWVGPAEVLIDDLGCGRVSAIEVGGASRAASVLAGIAGLPDRRGTAILVHDAARPIVPPTVVDRVLSPLADGWDAVVPSVPVTDTVKRIEAGGAVIETPARSTLVRAQTPQACRASALHAALRNRDEHELAAITDCSMAIELGGGRVLCVEGDPALAKVTNADDLRRVEMLLGVPVTVGAAIEDDIDDDAPLVEEDLVGLEPE